MRNLSKSTIERQRLTATRRLMQIRLAAAKRAVRRDGAIAPRSFRSVVQEALYFDRPMTAENWQELHKAGRCTMGALQKELDSAANAQKLMEAE